MPLTVTWAPHIYTEWGWKNFQSWIHAGHDRAGVPLTPAQLSALDALDRVAGDPVLRVEFALAPGQMYFLNNRWILHNRTAFDDHPEPERRRHLVRLWLRQASSVP